MTTSYATAVATLLFIISPVLTSCSSGDASTRRDFDPSRAFQRMDQDQDGLISWDEFKDGPTPRSGTREERFQQMDDDADGYVSLDEFIAATPTDRPGGGRGSGRGGGHGGMRMR